MMEIILSPQRRDDTMTLIREGNSLIINGETFDFSKVTSDAPLDFDQIESDWFAGPVERVNGTLRVRLILPHGPTPSDAVAFPAPIIDPPDGPITLPT